MRSTRTCEVMTRARESMTVTVALMGVCFVLTSAVRAQEYCVACTGPDAVYRCTIDQAAPTGMPLKMLCITTLAKEGGHATCAVRGGTVFDCNGPIRRIDAKAPGQPQSTPSDSSQVTPLAPTPPNVAPAGDKSKTATPPSQPKTAPGSDPPKTVEELAKRVGKSSGESLGKAGSTIANTTSKAWGCLVSFFKSC